MNYPIHKPKIGVVGGGQLARMMATQAHEMGFSISIMAESADACSVQVAPNAPVGDYTEYAELKTFAQNLDVLTFDHEHVPTEFLKELVESGVNVQPSPSALVYAQDKLKMRQMVQDLKLPNPHFSEVTSVQELLAFGENIGWPVILKTPRGGYDGKGVLVVEDSTQAQSQSVQSWFDKLAVNADMHALLAEEKVPFTRELSVLVARSVSGEIATWPVCESIQVDSVCDEVIAPAPALNPQTAESATEAAKTIAKSLGLTGVMAMEIFEVPESADGFYINELAMRPHNSGHWTQDGSVTSQFEQHLRAILDLPLGSTDMRDEIAIMKNFLGAQKEDIYAHYPKALKSSPRSKVHFYGKAVRPGRKLGHVNITGKNSELDVLRQQARDAADILAHGSDH